MPKLTHSPLNNILINSPEGIRIHPIYKEIKNHDGIDLDTENNTPVFAAHPGKVINAGNQVGVDKKGNPTGYGNFIVLYDKATDTVTLYAHLNSINVSIGQEITADQANGNNGFKIGLSGSTGRSTGNHLHFEVMQGSQLLADGKTTIVEQIGGTGSAAEKDNKLSNSVGIASSQSTKYPNSRAPRLKASEYLKKIPVVSLSYKVPVIDAQYDINFYGNIDPLSQVGDQLFIGDESLAGTAICLINPNSPNEGEHTWKLTTSTYKKEYILHRINNNNKKDPTGTRLLISPIDQGVDSKGNKIATTQNCIIINNFPFDLSLKSASEAANNNGTSTTAAPFGIKLGYLDKSPKFITSDKAFDESVAAIILANNNSANKPTAVGAVLFKFNGDSSYGVHNLLAKVTDRNGITVKDDISINSTASIKVNSPTIFPLSSGDWMVIYNNYDQNQGPLQTDVTRACGAYAEIYDYKGNITTDKFPIIDTTITPNTYRSFSQIYLLPEGNFVVFYNETANNLQTEYARAFDRKGNALSQAVKVINPVDYNPSTDLVATRAEGSRTIFYNGYEISTSGYLFNYASNPGSAIGVYSEDGSKRLDTTFPNQVTITQCKLQDPTQLPSIKLINLKTADQTTTSLTTIEGDNNIIELASVKAEFDVNGFNGMDGKNGNDKLDFSLLTANEEGNTRRLRFLQTANNNPLEIKYIQNNSDTVITAPSFPELQITLKKFNKENLKTEYFINGSIGNVDLKFIQPQTTQPSSNTNSGANTNSNTSNNLPLPNNTGTSTSLPNNPTPTESATNNSLPNTNNPTPTESTTSTSKPVESTTPNNTNPTPITQAKITGTNQTISFDQMAVSIPLQDIAITPINPNDKFEVKLTLLDKSDNPVKGAFITQGETSDGKYRSNYNEKTGIWQIVENFDPDDDKHITGTPALVDAKTANSLLQGNAIHALDKFKPQDFAINVYVRDVTNNQIYNNQIQADYQCMEIPDDLVKSMVRDQKSEVNKTLVMNFVNYLKDPRDRRFIGAEFKLMQAIRNDTIDPISNDSLLEIREFNKTTFEINGNKPGNYTMDFGVEQCNKFINHHFNLELTGNSSITDNTSNSNNLSTIIGASIGGAALLTAIGVAIWQRDKIKQCFNYLTGKGKNNEIEKRENKNEIELPANQDREHVDFQEVNKKNISMREIEERPDEIMNLTDNKKKINNSMELPRKSPIIKDIRSLKPENNQIEIG